MIAPTGSLGRLLKRDSAIVIASLAAVTLFAWLYLIVLAGAMAEGDMGLNREDVHEFPESDAGSLPQTALSL